MKVTEFKRKQTNVATKEKYEELSKKMRKEHEKMVKGMFEFIDAQGGSLEFTYRWFPEDTIKTITLVHGEITDLPMGIVKHLNNTYKKVRILEDNGNPDADKYGRGHKGIPSTCVKTSRVRFTPIDVI